MNLALLDRRIFVHPKRVKDFSDSSSVNYEFVVKTGCVLVETKQNSDFFFLDR